MERGGEEWLRGKFPRVMMDVKIVGEPDLDIVNPLTNNSLIKVSRLYIVPWTLTTSIVLQDFYRDPDNHSYLLQGHFLLAHFKQTCIIDACKINDQIKRREDVTERILLVIFERSIFSCTKVFSQVLLDEDRLNLACWNMLKRVFNSMVNHSFNHFLPFAGLIYLTTPFEKASNQAVCTFWTHYTTVTFTVLAQCGTATAKH